MGSKENSYTDHEELYSLHNFESYATLLQKYKEEKTSFQDSPTV